MHAPHDGAVEQRAETTDTEAPTPLRAARLALGLTVREVAESVGTAPSNLSRLELGHHPPPRALARALYRYYRGAIAPIDVYDPAFMDEVGVIEAGGDGERYTVVTRARRYEAHGEAGLRALARTLDPGARP